MAHVEKTKLRIQRRMIFDVAGDENVGTLRRGPPPAGRIPNRCSRPPAGYFPAGAADGGGAQVDVRGQHAGQLPQVHGSQIAGQAEAVRQIPRAGAGGFQHDQIVQMQLAGQPGHGPSLLTSSEVCAA